MVGRRVHYTSGFKSCRSTGIKVRRGRCTVAWRAPPGRAPGCLAALTCHMLGRTALTHPAQSRCSPTCCTAPYAPAGEMYDPPITRPVPLEVLHPLLSTPLAPFLPAYDTAAPPPASHAAATAAATAAAGPFAPTTSSASATVHANPAWAADDCGSGGAAGCGGDGGGCVEGAAARCGAHALYLAYLMRRGATRSAKSLLGLVMGQGHRRKAAVRWVGCRRGCGDWAGAWASCGVCSK